MKFSKNFERDYNWYLEHRHQFNFSGSKPIDINIDLINGKSAKECFYIYDTHGKNEFSKVYTKEPKLLSEILLCKESINFQIKEWAQGRADGTLPKSEFSIGVITTKYKTVVATQKDFIKKLAKEKLPFGIKKYLLDRFMRNEYTTQVKTIEQSSSGNTIQKEFDLLPWMIESIEKQKYKYYR